MLVTPAAIPPTIAPMNAPIPPANLTRIGMPLSMNSSNLGNFSTKAPIPTAKVTNPAMNNESAVNATTPNNANGATIDTFNNKFVIIVINPTNMLTLAVPF